MHHRRLIGTAGPRWIGLFIVWASAAIIAGCTKPHATTVPADPAAAPSTAPAAAMVAAKPSPAASAPATHQSLAHLTVRATGLRNHKGRLISGVFTSADGFPNVEGNPVNWQVK